MATLRTGRKDTKPRVKWPESRPARFGSARSSGVSAPDHLVNAGRRQVRVIEQEIRRFRVNRGVGLLPGGGGKSFGSSRRGAASPFETRRATLARYSV